MTAPLLTPVVRLAPAKLNLTLAVIGRRPDGFHDLHSIMAPLALADRLSLAPAVGTADTVHVIAAGGGPAPDCGPADRNLVLRAIAATRAALRERGVDEPLQPLAARLEKRIPVAAGLAGGSSDAAAALDGALEAWGVAAALGPPERTSVAASLGSDVPFFLARGWARVEGRGEQVTPLPGPRGTTPAVLLVTPALSIATATVFAAHAAGARPAGASTLLSSTHLGVELAGGLTTGRLLERAGILAVANDLAAAAAAVAPELGPFRRALGRIVGRPVGQSGSGPTLWVLYPSLAAAAGAESAVREALSDGRLVAPGAALPLVTATEVLASGAPSGDPRLAGPLLASSAAAPAPPEGGLP